MAMSNSTYRPRSSKTGDWSPSFYQQKAAYFKRKQAERIAKGEAENAKVYPPKS